MQRNRRGRNKAKQQAKQEAAKQDTGETTPAKQDTHAFIGKNE
jgi:hypothetical protein